MSNPKNIHLLETNHSKRMKIIMMIRKRGDRCLHPIQDLGVHLLPLIIKTTTMEYIIKKRNESRSYSPSRSRSGSPSKGNWNKKEENYGNGQDKISYEERYEDKRRRRSLSSSRDRKRRRHHSHVYNH